MGKWAYRIVPINHKYYIECSYIKFNGEYIWEYWKDFRSGFAHRLEFNSFFEAEKWVKDRIEMDQLSAEKEKQAKIWEAENAHIKDRIYEG